MDRDTLERRWAEIQGELAVIEAQLAARPPPKPAPKRDRKKYTDIAKAKRERREEIKKERADLYAAALRSAQVREEKKAQAREEKALHGREEKKAQAREEKTLHGREEKKWEAPQWVERAVARDAKRVRHRRAVDLWLTNCLRVTPVRRTRQGWRRSLRTRLSND
jgi:hypothetical protein